MNRLIRILAQRYQDEIIKETEYLINCGSSTHDRTAGYIQGLRFAIEIIEAVTKEEDPNAHSSEP